MFFPGSPSPWAEGSFSQGFHDLIHSLIWLSPGKMTAFTMHYAVISTSVARNWLDDVASSGADPFNGRLLYNTNVFAPEVMERTSEEE